LTVIPREFDYEDDQKIDGVTVYKEILKDAKLKTGSRGQEIQLTGRSPLRRRWFALDCSANEREG
jgi:hypothetical protein